MRRGYGPVAVTPGAGAAVGKISAHKSQVEQVPGMNCKEFEAAALEFVRGDVTEMPAQQNILAHARACAHCARRLGAERLLTSVVAAVIAQDRERSAPRRVENALVAAFRE